MRGDRAGGAPWRQGLALEGLLVLAGGTMVALLVLGAGEPSPSMHSAPAGSVVRTASAPVRGIHDGVNRHAGLDMAALAAEVAALKAAAEGERARLEAYHQAQDGLTATLDNLRQEVALVERRRDELHLELAELERRAKGACTAGLEAHHRAAQDAPRHLVSVAGAAAWNEMARRMAEPACGGDGTAAQAAPVAPMVVIHHRAGSALAQRAAELVAEEVRKADLGPVVFTPERAVPAVRTVRYARDTASEIGEQLAARFRSRWRHPWVVESSGHDEGAAPPEGLIEIWLPH